MNKKFLGIGLSTLMTLSLVAMPVNAQDNAIESIIAKTKVGDTDREAYSFEVTVSDASILEGLTAEDFDITGNCASTYYDAETGLPCADYVDDELTIDINENVLTLNFKPFAYSAGTWNVDCIVNDDLDFNNEKVTEVKTNILDDAIRGTFEYAGLTREYALYVPENASEPVPLVVWNHGGGEYNIDLETNLIRNRGLTAWNEQGYESAVLMIQVANPNYSYGTAESPEKQSLIDQNNALQAALIQKLIDDGTVDEKQVYITGASSGGGATMRFLMQYPEMVAGAIACCSHDPIVSVHSKSFEVIGREPDSFSKIVSNFEEAFKGEVYTFDEEQNKMVTKKVDTEALINVPIYFTHAKNDPTCQVTSSEAMFQAMKNLGDTNNQLAIWTNEEMKEAGISDALFDPDDPNSSYLLHFSWIKLFNETGEGTPMNWLFEQVKDSSTEDEETASVKTGVNVGIVLLATTMLLAAGTYVILRKRRSIK